MIDLTPFRVPCSACGRIHVVDPVLVPRAGATVACRVCGAKFKVFPPDAAVADPKPRAQPPPPAPTHVAVRLAWIFTDDPALQRDGVLPTLRAELTSHRTRMFDQAARDAFLHSNGPDWAQIFELDGCLGERVGSTQEWPHLLVFGDMHALMEDRLLQTAANRPQVHRILVSTHRNAELAETVREFCGFDRQLVLPITRADVRAALEPIPRHS